MQKIQGKYSLGSGAALRIVVHGNAPGAASGVSVQGGTVTLAGTLEISALPSLQTNTSFVIIENNDTAPVTGNFLGLPEGAAFFAGGFTWKISYRGGDGNDVVLTIVARTSPSVSVFQSRGQLALGWPEWAEAYQLCAATNLLQPVTWFPLAAPVVLSNAAFYTVLPSDWYLSFFRLQYP